MLAQRKMRESRNFLQKKFILSRGGHYATIFSPSIQQKTIFLLLLDLTRPYNDKIYHIVKWLANFLVERFKLKICEKDWQ
jgi:hypothetical protein